MSTIQDDIREKRKAINDMAYGNWPLSERREFNLPAHDFSRALVRRTLDSGRHNGLSGEDTMTVLAFHALEEVSRLYALVVDQVNSRPGPGIMVVSAADVSLEPGKH
mgnify:CR=1 FL=1